MAIPLLSAQRVFQDNVECPSGRGNIDGTPVPERFIDELRVVPGDSLVTATA